MLIVLFFFFFFQAEDGIRDRNVTGVQTCALPNLRGCPGRRPRSRRPGATPRHRGRPPTPARASRGRYGATSLPSRSGRAPPRSEERRVGKEWRPRGAAYGAETKRTGVEGDAKRVK